MHAATCSARLGPSVSLTNLGCKRGLPHHRGGSARLLPRQGRIKGRNTKCSMSRGGDDAEVDVAVIGGGPGGLAAAFALIAKGLTVRVYERSKAVQQVGALLSLFPNGLEALHKIDPTTYEAVLGKAEPPSSSVRMDPRGTLLGPPGPHPFSAMEGKYGHPFVNIIWYELTDVLRSRLPPGTVHLGHRCVGFEDAGAHVAVEFENQATVKARMVIGADGVRSVVRSMLLSDGPPTYTGIMSWRGVFDSDADILTPSRQASVTSGTDKGGPDKLFLAVDIQARKTAWVAFVLQAEDPSETPKLSDGAAHLDRVRSLFSDWEAPLLHRVLDATDSARVLPLGIFERSPADTWSGGRVTLVGDAAHAMQPWLGQGTNSTFEDVHTLAELLAAAGGPKVLGDRSAVVSVLKEYESRRIPRTKTLQSWSQSTVLRPLDQPPPPRATQFMRSAEEDDWMYTYDHAVLTSLA
ncbi:zeaxanthin epoxidase [Klebsormidium nitens]|uniref:Zeaxanthin epoxidase n=1 Tax=Klebsormidium nitens TaxID=105231 RepID=A0A1Y1I8D8_KLENI|nr:zeaxanthin epoxidase [Klebsormidium nitens]|eukprot:GAQ84956.1 zeaxanthin epoxidase [Klebsormidium nitens]